MSSSFSDLLKQTQGIMAAYRKMSGALVESSDDDLDDVHNGWKERVAAAHKDKEVIFRSKSSGGEHIISAEDKADPSRKALGLFNVHTKEAHIFHDGLTESTLTSEQKAKREEIIKGMKPNMDDFKKRYGDDAESVMYATATKKALEESVDTPPESSSVKHMGKTYSTYKFSDPDSANKFMSSPAGANYGFLVLDADGNHHCADMDDSGTSDT